MVAIIQNSISDEQIIALLKENNDSAWESLYDKYAPVMYGLIYNLTDDKVLAERILIHAFIQLKEKQTLSRINSGLCYTLLRYIYTFATNHFKEYGIIPKTLNPSEEVKLIHLFCIQCNSLKEIASILNLTEERTIKKVRSQLLKFRNQNKFVA
ncbi:MAG: hypothetical protein ABIO79_16200 [Ferruginibacter sp.]